MRWCSKLPIFCFVRPLSIHRRQSVRPPSCTSQSEHHLNIKISADQCWNYPKQLPGRILNRSLHQSPWDQARPPSTLTRIFIRAGTPNYSFGKYVSFVSILCISMPRALRLSPGILPDTKGIFFAVLRYHSLIFLRLTYLIVMGSSADVAFLSFITSFLCFSGR